MKDLCIWITYTTTPWSHVRCSKPGLQGMTSKHENKARYSSRPTPSDSLPDIPAANPRPAAQDTYGDSRLFLQ